MRFTNQRAYVKRPLLLILLSDEKGFRCSEEALKTRTYAGRDCTYLRHDVVSVRIQNEIFWISADEFKRSGLEEYPVKALD